jgi:cytochrome c biogenesis factor
MIVQYVNFVLNLFKQSVQGPDGKYSSKKLTLFLFCMLGMILHFVYFYVLWCKQDWYTLQEITDSVESILLIDVGVILGLVGVNTYSTVQTMKTLKKGPNKEEQTTGSNLQQENN